MHPKSVLLGRVQGKCTILLNYKQGSDREIHFFPAAEDIAELIKVDLDVSGTFLLLSVRVIL